MSQIKINLLQIPNQSLSCNLTDGKGNYFAVDITLRTLPDGRLCAKIAINDNVMPLIPTNILNGNIYFKDTYFDTDPKYIGFNEQYLLIYDTEFKLG